MLSKDLQALSAWFSGIVSGAYEMTPQGAQAFALELAAAVEKAEALELSADLVRYDQVMHGRLGLDYAGPHSRAKRLMRTAEVLAAQTNVVPFRRARPVSAYTSEGEPIDGGAA